MRKKKIRLDDLERLLLLLLAHISVIRKYSKTEGEK